MKGKKALFLGLMMAMSLFLFTGCSGNELPSGMDEATLIAQGREIMTLLNEGEWQAVYDRMRADGQATTDPDGIQEYMEAVLKENGSFVKEEEYMATGQELESTGEEYGTAVFYCKHEKEDVLYRFAFSTDMELMGLQVGKKS